MCPVLDCPSCHQKVTLPEELVGQTVACPHCTGHFSAPPDGAKPVPLATPRAATAFGLGIRFTFSCQRCGSVLESRTELCDQPGRCPTCGAVFTVPKVDAQTGLATGPAVVEDDGQLPTPLHAYAMAGSRSPKIRRLDSGSQVIICPRCRGEMPVDADTCTACGIPFTMDGAASVSRAGGPGNGLATAALTVGILAILSSCLPILAPIAIGLGIAGLRRAGQTQTAGSGRGMAIAGIICGLAALGLAALIHLVA